MVEIRTLIEILLKIFFGANFVVKAKKSISTNKINGETQFVTQKRGRQLSFADPLTADGGYDTIFTDDWGR